jgi:hypothetical protein
MDARFLLKSIPRNEFFAGRDCWTPDCSSAFLFPHTYTALLKGLDFQEPTEVVLCLGTPEASVYIRTRPCPDDGVICQHCPYREQAQN